MIMGELMGIFSVRVIFLFVMVCLCWRMLLCMWLLCCFILLYRLMSVWIRFLFVCGWEMKVFLFFMCLMSFLCLSWVSVCCMIVWEML